MRKKIEKVLPEVVGDSGTGANGEESYKTVAYGNMTALLVEAVKEQQKQIEELQAKLDNFVKAFAS